MAARPKNLLSGRRLGEVPGAREAVDDLWWRLLAWQARTGDPLDLPAPGPCGTLGSVSG